MKIHTSATELARGSKILKVLSFALVAQRDPSRFQEMFVGSALWTSGKANFSEEVSKSKKRTCFPASNAMRTLSATGWKSTERSLNLSEIFNVNLLGEIFFYGDLLFSFFWESGIKKNLGWKYFFFKGWEIVPLLSSWDHSSRFGQMAGKSFIRDSP
jgi:hypothetical protein